MVPRTDLSELSVGDQECSQGLETLYCLLTILLCGVLRDAHGGSFGINGDLLSLPNKILQEFAFVLGQEQLLGLINDVAQVLDKDLAIVGKFCRWRGESLGVQSTV